MKCLLIPHSTTSRVLRRTIPLTGNSSLKTSKHRLPAIPSIRVLCLYPVPNLVFRPVSAPPGPPIALFQWGAMVCPLDQRKLANKPMFLASTGENHDGIPRLSGKPWAATLRRFIVTHIAIFNCLGERLLGSDWQQWGDKQSVNSSRSSKDKQRQGHRPYFFRIPSGMVDERPYRLPN